MASRFASTKARAFLPSQAWLDQDKPCQWNETCLAIKHSMESISYRDVERLERKIWMASLSSAVWIIVIGASPGSFKIMPT